MVVKRHYVREFPRRSPVKAKISRQESERCNEIPFTETRLLLAILGVVPCQLHRPYLPSLDLCKSSLLYCVVVYSLASCNVAWTIRLKVQQFAEVDSSDVVNQNLLFEQLVLALFPHLLGFILLTDTNAISACIKSFSDIQDQFFAATGKEFLNRRKRLERACYCIALLLPGVFYIYSQNYVPIMFVKPTTAAAMIYSNLILFMINIYWIGVSFSFTDVLDDVKSTFETLLINKEMTAQSMFKFRLLWLSLRAGMDSLGKLSVPAAVHSIILFLAVVLLYGGAKCIKIGEMYAGAGVLVTAVFYLVYVSVACIASDRAQLKMKTLLNDILPNVTLSYYDNGTQREVVMLYLSENARPGVLTMRGFTVINKTLVLSFLTNIATYIIVIVQFLDKS